MKTSAAGRALIEAFEGLFLRAYQDSVGVWTIGYGHTTAAGGPAVKPGMTITAEQADQLLADDLGRVEQNVTKVIRATLNQSEFDALVSFDFNTGALSQSSVTRKLNNGDKAGAMQTLLLYNHAGGQVLRGLTRRRQAEKLLFEGKVEKALALAGVKSVPKEKEPTPPPPDIEPTPQPAQGQSFLVRLLRRLFSKA